MNKIETTLNSVLLVDDNSDDNFIHTRQILHAGLVQSEEDVIVTKNGEEALEFFENFEKYASIYGERYPPRLVLLDINMPVMDGFDFLDRYEKLAQDPRYQSVIILMLTSSDHVEDRRRASDYRCLSGFYTKPMTLARLQEIVAKHIR